MIWWYGEQYEDKQDALAKGAYENDDVILLPIVRCRCCGDNELDKIKWWINHYEAIAEKAWDEQQARPQKKISRAARPSWEDYELDMRYATNNAAAGALKYVLKELEGRGGCW